MASWNAWWAGVARISSDFFQARSSSRSCSTLTKLGRSRPRKGWERGSNHARLAGYEVGVGESADDWVLVLSWQVCVRSFVYCLRIFRFSCWGV